LFAVVISGAELLSNILLAHPKPNVKPTGCCCYVYGLLVVFLHVVFQWMVEGLMPNKVLILHANYYSKVPMEITQLNHHKSK
jgi:hypothetical protein